MGARKTCLKVCLDQGKTSEVFGDNTFGAVSQGTTIEEAISNLKEATELYSEEFPVFEITHPLLKT